MITTNILLKICLSKAEKLHSILRFVYDTKKRKALLASIKNNRLAMMESRGELNEEGSLMSIKFKMHKIDSYRLVKEIKKKIIEDTDRIRIITP